MSSLLTQASFAREAVPHELLASPELLHSYCSQDFLGRNRHFKHQPISSYYAHTCLLRVSFIATSTILFRHTEPSRSTIGGGGDVTKFSPFWEGTARQ